MIDEPAPKDISFACTQCSGNVRVAADRIGQQVHCPFCQASLMVPAHTSEESGPRVELETVVQTAPVEAAAFASASTEFGSPSVQSIPITMQGTAQSNSSATISVVSAGQAVVNAPVTHSNRPAHSSQDAVSNTSRFAHPRNPAFVEPGKKTGTGLIAGVLIVCILGFLGYSISRSMAHAEMLRTVDEGVAQASQHLNQGELDQANALAAKARSMIDANRKEIEAEKLMQWQPQLDRIQQFNNKLNEIQELFAKAKEDPTKVKHELERKRTLLNNGKPEVAPLLRHLDKALAKTLEIEREYFLAQLNAQLNQAEGIYAKGDFGAAAQQARNIHTQMKGSLKVTDEGLKRRADRLIDHQKMWMEAMAAHGNALADFGAAKRNLQKLTEQVGHDIQEDQPLRGKIEDLLNDIAEQERLSLKLNPKDLEKLKRVADDLANRELGLEVGKQDTHTGVLLSFEDHIFHLGQVKEGDKDTLALVVQDQRFLLNEPLLKQRPALPIRMAQGLGKEMKDAGLARGHNWNLVADSAFPLARRDVEAEQHIFYRGRLFKGKLDTIEAQNRSADEVLKKACVGLINDINGDKEIADDVKKVVTKMVEGAFQKLDWYDHLPISFCRKALADGYLEQNLPAFAKRHQEALNAFQEAYGEITHFRPVLKGKSEAHGDLILFKNFSGEDLTWDYDPKADVSSFAVKNPVEDRHLLYIVYAFKGRMEEWPESQEPLSVSMTHPAAGVLARYDCALKKLEFDPEHWATGAGYTTSSKRSPWRGDPDWEFPPHVLLINKHADPKSIVTPAGRVDLLTFSNIADVSARRTAQSQYIDRLAEVLNTTGYLHLYFLYFHQYVLDSPIVTETNLLGSRAYCGDIHQTVYESLDRKLGGRYLGDCDDLAELFMTITRRQGKLSFVMAVPGHATCGWVEKKGEAYQMQFLDTGPPRFFQGNNIENLVEIGSRSYDDKKTMRFDPKSLGFLFRFAGEETRTPYYLSTRMFEDRPYAETMERVQGYWHFHLYWLGIQTMEEMIAKGDRVPENCTELAGLYGRVREFEKAIHWTREGTKQLDEKDTLTRLGDTFRMGDNYRESKQLEKAYQTIQPAVAELLKLSSTEDWLRYVSERLSMASLLTSLDRPWEAWDLLKRDAFFFAQRGAMRLDHAGNLTSVYEKMTELIREKGLKLSPEETLAMNQLSKLLDWFYQNAVFQTEDDFNDILRNYAFIGMYYSAKNGRDKWAAELLQDGPFPTRDKNHRSRSTSDLDDWKWIRLSPLSYSIQIRRALDPDKPKEEWRIPEAVKMSEAMFRAAEQAQKFGSLGSNEFMLLTTRVMHGFLTKNWNAIEDIFKEVKAKNYARFTSQVAETMGECARFVTPEEFEQQYRVFAKYVKTKAPYFNVVYEAYRNDSFEHARRAALVALECWPNEENMKREVEFLDVLIKNRLREKTEKEKEQEKAAPKEANSTKTPESEAVPNK